MSKATTVITLIMTLLASPWACAAQKLSIELNKVEQIESSCHVFFLARNSLEQPINSLSFETVLLDQQGAITRLAVLDFLDLPAQKIRMRQFEFPSLQCDDVKQLLFNSLISCHSNASMNTDSQATSLCANKLVFTSSTNIEVLD